MGAAEERCSTPRRTGTAVSTCLCCEPVSRWPGPSRNPGQQCLRWLRDDHGWSSWGAAFWEQPLSRWDVMFSAGVRSHMTACHFAVLLMLSTRRQWRLIVNATVAMEVEQDGAIVLGRLAIG